MCPNCGSNSGSRLSLASSSSAGAVGSAQQQQRRRQNQTEDGRSTNGEEEQGQLMDLNLNQILLLETQRRSVHEAYEEMKRLLVLAGIFFFFAVLFLLMRYEVGNGIELEHFTIVVSLFVFQFVPQFWVSLDDAIKWSPVIWLLGVISCGLVMNLVLQLRRFRRIRRANRERERDLLLRAIRRPDSFPCLMVRASRAQIPSRPFCCVHQQMIREAETAANCQNPAALPGYEQSDQFPLVSPPAFVVVARPSGQPEKAPPKYREAEDQSAADNQSMGSSAATDENPPEYN